jgi:hypothetical protein
MTPAPLALTGVFSACVADAGKGVCEGTCEGKGMHAIRLVLRVVTDITR